MAGFRYFFNCVAAFFFMMVGQNLVLASDAPNYVQDRHADGFWKTEKAQFLDSKSVLEIIAKAEFTATEEVKRIGINKSVQSIYNLLLAELADDHGVHVETAMTALGAIGGFACQMGIRDELVFEGSYKLEELLTQVETKDGNTYFFGPTLNACLLSDNPDELSLWSLLQSGLKDLKKPAPDHKSIVTRVTAAMGSDTFGVPDVADEHMPHQTSQALLWKFWNMSRNIMALQELPPRYWRIVIALTGVKLLKEGQAAVDPTLAAQLYMEAAISMSKVDPAKIYAASMR